MDDTVTGVPYDKTNITAIDTPIGSKDLGDSIIAILNGVIGILAVVCVVVIVIGGVQYMTSSGDAAKVKKAKDTILYALIGLVICALAAAIVNFVIAQVLKTTV